jgi:hypothetical protein
MMVQAQKWAERQASRGYLQKELLQYHFGEEALRIAVDDSDPSGKTG